MSRPFEQIIKCRKEDNLSVGHKSLIQKDIILLRKAGRPALRLRLLKEGLPERPALYIIAYSPAQLIAIVLLSRRFEIFYFGKKTKAAEKIINL